LAAILNNTLRGPATDLELVTPAGTLRGLRWGIPGNMPVLALHGWLDNAASFAQLGPLLENSDIVAIDLPGHGCSDHRPPGSRYHFVDYIPAVLDAMTALAWPKCVLLGHSLGAAIATFTAAVEPNRVQGLFLIDGLGPHSETPQEAPARLQRSIREFSESVDKIDIEHSDLNQMIDARRQAGRVGKQGAALLVARNTVPSETGYRWRSDPRLRLPNPQYMTEEQILAYIAQVRAPALLVIAREGMLRGRAMTKERAAVFPGLKVEELPGGHHLHLDDPESIARLANDFLCRMIEKYQSIEKSQT
jgi:pimeloyl-ACP methyl ester carboxylesterase